MCKMSPINLFQTFDFKMHNHDHHWQIQVRDTGGGHAEGFGSGPSSKAHAKGFGGGAPNICLQKLLRDSIFSEQRSKINNNWRQLLSAAAAIGIYWIWWTIKYAYNCCPDRYSLDYYTHHLIPFCITFICKIQCVCFLLHASPLRRSSLALHWQRDRSSICRSRPGRTAFCKPGLKCVPIDVPFGTTGHRALNRDCPGQTCVGEAVFTRPRPIEADRGRCIWGSLYEAIEADRGKSARKPCKCKFIMQRIHVSNAFSCSIELNELATFFRHYTNLRALHGFTSSRYHIIF